MLKRTMIWVLIMAMTVLAGTAAAQEWDIAQTVYQEGAVAVTDAEREVGNPIFLIVMEDGGEIRGELYPDVAPQSVGNFIALANSGFYDGLIFHRVLPGFMIQGGQRVDGGSRSPGWRIRGEFAANQIANALKHEEGVLSMARSNDFDSASSQFFLMAAPAPHLDGGYAAFGKMFSGMDVVNRIVNAPRNADDKPDEDQRMKTVRVETFGKEYPFDKL